MWTIVNRNEYDLNGAQIALSRARGHALFRPLSRGGNCSPSVKAAGMYGFIRDRSARVRRDSCDVAMSQTRKIAAIDGSDEEHDCDPLATFSA